MYIVQHGVYGSAKGEYKFMTNKKLSRSEEIYKKLSRQDAKKIYTFWTFIKGRWWLFFLVLIKGREYGLYIAIGVALALYIWYLLIVKNQAAIVLAKAEELEKNVKVAQEVQKEAGDKEVYSCQKCKLPLNEKAMYCEGCYKKLPASEKIGLKIGEKIGSTIYKAKNKK